MSKSSPLKPLVLQILHASLVHHTSTINEGKRKCWKKTGFWKLQDNISRTGLGQTSDVPSNHFGCQHLTLLWMLKTFMFHNETFKISVKRKMSFLFYIQYFACRLFCLKLNNDSIIIFRFLVPLERFGSWNEIWRNWVRIVEISLCFCFR